MKPALAVLSTGHSAPEKGLSIGDIPRWIDGVLAEGFSLSRKQRPLLLVRARKFEGEIPCGLIDSLEEAFFLRKGDETFLGIGSAKVWAFLSGAPLQEIRAALKLDYSTELAKTWLLGGWSFPPSRRGQRSETWKNFPYSRWVVPALLFAKIDGMARVILAVCFDSKPEKALKRYYGRLLDATTARRPASMPAQVRSEDMPSRRRWVSLADRALDAISRGELKKVVLARSVRITFDGEIPCARVLERLIESNPDSAVFAMKHGDTVFLGATPERLVSLKDGEVRVDCLAGSAPRSEDASADDSMGADLIKDEKSRREHRLVVQTVTASLSTMSSGIRVSSPRLKKLSTVQHLHTAITARLLPGVDIWKTAISLWPTPATAGEPRKKAVRWIKEFEPVSRGWYSGVVGCVNGEGEGTLVVAIRSAVVRGDTAVVFAGSGLVSGSRPELEFEETNWKMQTMTRALQS